MKESESTSKFRRGLRGLVVVALLLAAMLAGLGGAAFADSGAARSFPGCPVLREGATGSCVGRLQTYLNGVADYGLKTDQRFGPATRIAVLDYQGRHHLGADARVGATTADALTVEYNELHPQAPPVNSPKPLPGSLTSSGCDLDRGLVGDGHGNCVPDGGSLGGRPIVECAGAALGLTKQGLDIYKIVKDSRALGYSWETGVAPKLVKAAPWVTAAFAFKCGWWDTPS